MFIEESFIPLRILISISRIQNRSVKSPIRKRVKRLIISSDQRKYLYFLFASDYFTSATQNMYPSFVTKRANERGKETEKCP